MSGKGRALSRGWRPGPTVLPFGSAGQPGPTAAPCSLCPVAADLRRGHRALVPPPRGRTGPAARVGPPGPRCLGPVAAARPRRAFRSLQGQPRAAPARRGRSPRRRAPGAAGGPAAAVRAGRRRGARPGPRRRHRLPRAGPAGRPPAAGRGRHAGPARGRHTSAHGARPAASAGHGGLAAAGAASGRATCGLVTAPARRRRSSALGSTTARRWPAARGGLPRTYTAARRRSHWVSLQRYGVQNRPAAPRYIGTRLDGPACADRRPTAACRRTYASLRGSHSRGECFVWGRRDADLGFRLCSVCSVRTCACTVHRTGTFVKLREPLAPVIATR